MHALSIPRLRVAISGQRPCRVLTVAALPDRLQGLAQRWLSQDADRQSRQQIEQLVELENEQELQDLLGERLQFGELKCRPQSALPGATCVTNVTEISWPASFSPPTVSTARKVSRAFIEIPTPLQAQRVFAA